jgi:hypothetical protein
MRSSILAAVSRDCAPEPRRPSCDPENVAQVYSEDSEWRNRTEFFEAGRRSTFFSKGIGLPIDEGAVVLHWESDFAPFRIRMA